MATKYDDEEMKILLHSIAAKINDAKALNGGFDRLREDVSSLREDFNELRIDQAIMRADIEHIKKQNEETSVAITKITDSLYNPEGIYTKISMLTNSTDELYDDVEKISKKSDSLERRLRPVETSNHDIVSKSKKKDKLFWTGLTALFAAFAKTIWDFIVSGRMH